MKDSTFDILRRRQLNEVFGYQKSPGYKYPSHIKPDEQLKDTEAEKLAKLVHKKLKTSKMGRVAPTVVRDVLEKSGKGFSADNLHRDKKVEHVLTAMKKNGWKQTVKTHKGQKLRVFENLPLWKRLKAKRPK